MDELDTDVDPPVACEVQTDDTGTVIVTISGELDMTSVGEVDEKVAPALAGAPDRLIVDVAGVRFADSSAIALWLRWAGSVKEFELRDPSPILQRVIATIGLGKKLGAES